MFKLSFGRYLLVHIINHANIAGNYVAMAIIIFFSITVFTISGESVRCMVIVLISIWKMFMVSLFCYVEKLVAKICQYCFCKIILTIFLGEKTMVNLMCANIEAMGKLVGHLVPLPLI